VTGRACNQSITLFARAQRHLDGAGVGHVRVNERDAAACDRTTVKTQHPPVGQALLDPVPRQAAGAPPGKLAHTLADPIVGITGAEIATFRPEPEHCLERRARPAQAVGVAMEVGEAAVAGD
jgi:hypothetical protein